MTFPKSSNPTLIFTGRMDRVENVDAVVSFARTVVPRLRQRFADMEFLIVGQSPTSSVHELEKIPGVVVTGAVGDIRPFLARCWIFVAPHRAACGTALNVLEAMASQLPVVCTEPVLGELRELGLRPQRDLILSTDVADLERAICRLIDDAELRSLVGTSARQRIGWRYSWERHERRFENILSSVVRSVAWNADKRGTERIPVVPSEDVRGRVGGSSLGVAGQSAP